MPALPARHPLPPRRPGHPAPAELAAMREASRGPSFFPLVPEVTVAELSPGGVRTLELTPPGALRGTMVWFHGGGYRQGSPDRMTGFLSQLAVQAQCRVLAPAYALAPEAPYPAALHDAAEVLAAEQARAPEEALVIAGDSAGGGLAAAACLAFGAALPGLRGAVLLSPWVDLTITADTFERCAQSDILFSRESAETAAGLYLQGLSADLPLASPLFAENLADMPPTLIIAGSAEVLLQDSVDFAARLAAQHVGVELMVVPHMQHVSPALFPGLPSTARGQATMARFIAAQLSGEGALGPDPQSGPAGGA